MTLLGRGTRRGMYLRRQCEYVCMYVCIELKNANAYVPMLYAESPAPSAAGDSAYSVDNQEITILCWMSHTFGNDIFQ